MLYKWYKWILFFFNVKMTFKWLARFTAVVLYLFFTFCNLFVAFYGVVVRDLPSRCVVASNPVAFCSILDQGCHIYLGT
jgi:hypothetical protein